MQMSIERFREIHKMMWDYVIAHAEDMEENRHSLYYLKGRGLDKAYYDKGLLDYDELIVIENNCNCLLCASVTTCQDCILGTCRTYDSLYREAMSGDVRAMEAIRDVVDRWPYTEMTIVTLHDHL